MLFYHAKTTWKEHKDHALRVVFTGLDVITILSYLSRYRPVAALARRSLRPRCSYSNWWLRRARCVHKCCWELGRSLDPSPMILTLARGAEALGSNARTRTAGLSECTCANRDSARPYLSA